MGDSLFSNAGGLALLPVDGQDDLIELVSEAGASPVRLDRGTAKQLAEALRRWAVGTADPKAEGFLVYYLHEYADNEGNIAPCPDLGEPNAEHEYTFHEESLAAVRQRVASIGTCIAALHAASQGFDRDEDHARAWVSIFRLPEDVRVWKGYWDELPDSPDSDLDV